jgi:hypothetical protein
VTPETLKALSLYSSLEALFQAARAKRDYSLNALPEGEVANLLVERLASVIVEAEDLIERLCGRQSSRQRAA